MEQIDDYFSLNDILASCLKVPCKVMCSLQNIGAIIPGNPGKNIPTNSTVELPLWIVKDLARREGIIEFECPKYYKKAYRDIHDASATVLNLHKMGPYFYMDGIKFSKIRSQEAFAIYSCIHKVYFFITGFKGKTETYSRTFYEHFRT